MRAYPDYTNIDSYRLRRQQVLTLYGRRALTVQSIKNLYSNRLTVSYIQEYSARELCANKMLLRLDFVLIAEGAFCDIETATLQLLCTTIQIVDCFNLDSQRIQRNRRIRDILVEKVYKYTDEQKQSLFQRIISVSILYTVQKGLRLLFAQRQHACASLKTSNTLVNKTYLTREVLLGKRKPAMNF